MLRRVACLLLCTLAVIPFCQGSEERAGDAGALVQEAAAAERSGNVETALALYRRADAAKPDDAAILQKISKQLSDSISDSLPLERKLQLAREALAVAERALTLAPEAPACVLSVAVCHGKLALLSPARERIEHARLVREHAERALQLDPRYDWAHHVLGRWHCELAQIAGPKRAMARLLYAPIPKGTCREGLAHLEKAVEIAPECAAHRLELGAALYACGDRAEAKKHLLDGLQLPSRERQDHLSKVRARAILELMARNAPPS